MTASNIPNSLSGDDLQRLLENAQSEETDTPEIDSREHIDLTAIRLVQEAVEECRDPLVHKAMVVHIINGLIQWHDTMSEKMFERGETKSAIAWAADKGKFQSMMNILLTINLGEEDWMTSN